MNIQSEFLLFVLEGVLRCFPRVLLPYVRTGDRVPKIIAVIVVLRYSSMTDGLPHMPKALESNDSPVNKKAYKQRRCNSDDLFK